MTDTIQVERGSTIRFSGTWQDENGEPIDVTGWEIGVADANHAVIGTHMVAEITDPAAGQFQVKLAADHADTLPLGRRSNFRLEMTMPGGDVEASMLIWIEIA